jgi:hypothetical protein
MFILRQNPNGGHPLKGYPLSEDPHTKDYGFKIGYLGKCAYCGKSEGEPILVRISDAEDVALKFAGGLMECKKLLKQKEHIPVKLRVFRWIIGKKAYRKLMIEEGIEETVD